MEVLREVPVTPRVGEDDLAQPPLPPCPFTTCNRLPPLRVLVDDTPPRKECDWQTANLSGVWWPEVDARKADFFRANLEKAGLEKAHLEDAAFYEANLS
ncbi:MAG: pentapeptide repeat-containing protein [Myxococcota bacterium]|nr:pentapeptide repeat-containing protein [Myxococcota bacterium]